MNRDASQTVEFVDTDVGEKVEFKSSSIAMSIPNSQPNLDLNRFLARPTLIQTPTWNGAGIDVGRFNPWTDFLTNSYIENKLKNYALIRGQLHVKVTITANPFTYGALLLSYTPLVDQMTESIETSTGALQNSQKPHIWVWPQDNAGGEMVLPFFWRSNYLNMLTTTDTDRIGELFFEVVTALDTANDVTVPDLTIQVYAWMTDVMLECPTTQAILQGGDEYSQGPVERMGSAVAAVARAAQQLPIIAPFALATEIGAQAVSGIAALFGWSKVLEIENSRSVKNRPTHGMATSDISDAGDKLAIDPKCELTVDPRVVNLSGQDELSMSYILQKEAYIANANWLASDALGAQLFEIPIWPMLMRLVDNTTYQDITMTPMAYFGTMFQYWRGDIILRFRLVASRYHRGRIKITFEPQGEVGAGEYSNVAITKIVDITEECDFEITIPYMQEYPWCKNPFDPADDNSIGYDYGKTGSAAHVDSITNGTVRVQVFTTLTSPQAAPSCHVLAFARGSPSLEMAVPRDIGASNLSLLTLQSGEEIQTNQSHPQRFHVNFGESITSLRQVLCRSSLSHIYKPFSRLASSNFQYVIVIKRQRLPASPGYNSDAYLYSESMLTPTTNARFTFSYMHPINWVSACYAGLRGGVQHTVLYDSPNTFGKIGAVKAARRHGLIGANDATLDTNPIALTAGNGAVQTHVEYAYPLMHSTRGGMGLTSTHSEIMPSLTFEVPDQHQCVLNTTRQSDWLLGSSFDDTRTTHLEYFADIRVDGGNDLLGDLRLYMNIAPDFNLHFFVCTPTVYWFDSDNFGQPKYDP